MGLSDAVGAFNKFNPWAWLRVMSDNNLAILANAGAPTNGTSGTFAGKAGPGCMVVDTTNAVLYINTGTKASPVWVAVSGGGVTGLAGLGPVGVAKMTYDFDVDGGAQGAIIPTNSPTIPDNAIILGGALDITTAVTSGGSATVALGTSAGSSSTSILGATAVASLTAVLTNALVPKFTAATIFKMTAAGRLNMTVATADLIGGVFDLNVLYVVGN